MKKIVSVFCLIIMAFMFSACASFKSVEEADSFLAAEKAKGTKPKTKIIGSSVLPQNNAGNKALSYMSNPGLLSLFFLPVLAVQAGAVAASAATYAATPEENLWRQVVAVTDYGRFVEHKSCGMNERKAPTIFDKVIQEVGVPPLPCVMIGKYFNHTSDKFKWGVDEPKGIYKGYANKLRYAVTYKTLLTENAVPGQAPAICTQRMAEDHFSKIVKIMEDR
jgi:hypothetical protein